MAKAVTISVLTSMTIGVVVYYVFSTTSVTAGLIGGIIGGVVGMVISDA